MAGKIPLLISFLFYTLQHTDVTGEVRHPTVPTWKQ